MTDFWIFQSPIGTLGLGAEEGELVRLYLPNTPLPRMISHKTPLMEQAEGQLMEYFQGRRQSFDLPMKPEGTPFQTQVWSALLQIPYGQTRSYGEIACQLGKPGGARAVGHANGCNPLPILIPCHRVIARSGGLGGYAGGIELKKQLLELEKNFTALEKIR